MTKLIKILLFLNFGISNLLAQDLNITEIRVVEDFIPNIGEADRLNEKAIFVDTIRQDKTQNFNIITFTTESDYKTKPLSAAKIKKNKLNELFKNSLSLGFGNRFLSEMDIVYNSLQSKNNSNGVILNHYNTSPKIDNKLASKTSSNLYAYYKKINNKKTYSASFNYNRTALFSYGNGSSNKSFDNSITRNNPFLNRFSFTKLFFLIKNTEPDKKNILRECKIYISDLNEFSENQLHVSTVVDQEINGLPISFNFKYNNYLNYFGNDNLFQNTKTQSLYFMPINNFKKNGYNFNISIPIYYVFIERYMRFFPQFNIKKELVKDILSIEGGSRQFIFRNTLNYLSETNPYIHTYGTNQSIIHNNIIKQDLRTTYREELFFLVSNMISKNEKFNIEISYGKIDNLSYFKLIDNQTYKRFNVNYLESVMQTNIRINYSNKINDFLNIYYDLNYYDRDKKIDHLEDLFTSIMFEINLRNKIYLTSSMLYKGKRFSANNELSPIFNSNIGLYYNYSKQLSAYIKINNLTNSKKEFWDSYKEIGITVLTGAKYSF